MKISQWSVPSAPWTPIEAGSRTDGPSVWTERKHGCNDGDEDMTNLLPRPVNRARAMIILGFIFTGLGIFGLSTAGQAQELSFPEDAGRHRGSDFEMWSFLAHVEGDSGRPMGLGVMFFTGRIVGLNVSGTFHLVTDESEPEWFANRDLVLPLFGRKRHTEGRLDEAYDRSRLWTEPATDRIRIVVRSGGWNLDLAFEPTLDPVDFGTVPVAEGAEQRIYARPAGRVTGELSRDGGPTESLTGIGVFQHAWGDSPDPSRTGSLLSAHLDDGRAVVSYHGEDEEAPHRLAVVRPGSAPVVTESFTAEAARSVSPRSGDDVAFPVEWTLQAAESGPIPSVDVRFERTSGGQPVEVLGMPFWVGRCRITGMVGESPVEGSGYVLIRGVQDR